MTEFTYQRMDGKNYSAEDIKRIIKERNIRFIKLQFVDINGQVKNISIPATHIDKVLANEIMLDGSSIRIKIRLKSCLGVILRVMNPQESFVIFIMRTAHLLKAALDVTLNV